MQSVRRNFLYYALLTAVRYVFPLLTFPYVTRVLGVTNIGICSFVDSIIDYFIIVSMLGTDLVGIREIARCRGDHKKLNEVFNGLFWLNSIITSIALVLLFIVTLNVDQLREHWQMMCIGGLKLLMNYMLIEWLYTGLEAFRYITTRTIIVRLLYVIAVFVFIHEQNDYPIYYLLTVSTIASNALINLLYSRKFVRLRLHGIHLRLFVKPVMTMGVYQILTSMYTTFNVVFLGLVANKTEVGYYTTGSKLTNMVLVLFTAFTSVMLPRMSSIASDDMAFKDMLTKSNRLLFTFSVPLFIFSFIFAPTIVGLIAGSGYEGAILPMRIMVLLIIIIGYEQIIIVQALAPLKKDSAILRNSIIGALTGLGLNIALVPIFKSVGTSVVWVSSEFIVLCSAQYQIYRSLQLNFPWHLLRHHLLMNIPLAIILYLLFVIDAGNRFIFFVAIPISVLYFFIVNYNYVNTELLKGKSFVKLFSV